MSTVRLHKQLVGTYSNQYRDTLLNDVVLFWMKHSPNREFWGYLPCLDREGNVFDIDKFI